MNLDVEGNELDVLQTIPFDSVFIKTISVEYIHNSGGRNAVKQFMVAKGFRVFGEVTDPRNWANDLVFVNERL
ncbi:Protein Star [Orchesella cincta]|uniref:Protein Star n=1 Tax=Orchesella cincta TaxID=48709 RepID=A0A1D2MNG3_ORCCI|nr:Protein Star [Orchesella cincta]